MAIQTTEVVLFTNTAGRLMLGGHGSFIRCLSSAAQQQTNPEFRAVLSHVLGLIKQGVALSTAMERFPSAFHDDLVALVRRGEKAGDLENVLSHARITWII